MSNTIAATIFVAFFIGPAITVKAQSESRDQVLSQIETKRAELSALEKKFLAPSDEDQAAYSEFLKQPDTGLIRLLPREIFDSEVYRERRKSLTMRGGGAYYSFTRLTHEYGFGSDISLDSNYLSVGFAGADYGMLLKLGNVPLEDVNMELPTAQFIWTYKPPTLEADVRAEQRRFGLGTLVDDTLYKERVPVETNATYVLRSISFDRTDILVALRVLRKDADGSVIILWKLLKNYPKPELTRNQVAN